MWIQRFFRSPTSNSTRRQPTGKPLRAFRPRLEALEDRCLLSFIPAVNYPVGLYPEAAVGADFNGDGRPDLAVAVANNVASNLSVLLANGDSTFQAVRISAAGYNPTSLAVGDFNEDGRLDAATSNADDVRVYLGNGDGTFQAGQVVSVSGPTPLAVAVGDVDGDGRVDLVATSFYQEPLVCDAYGCSSGVQGYMDVLLGRGDGTFPVRNTYSLGGVRATALALGDMNGDGRQDVVVASNESGSVGVWLGNGDGTLQARGYIDTVHSHRAVAVADFNGDGWHDIVMADGTTLGVWLGNGDGTLRYGGSYASGSIPSSLTVADFNRDGQLDVAAANAGYWDEVSGTIVGSSLVLLMGNGDGSLQAAQELAAGSNPVLVVGADFNADAFPDLAVVDGGSGNVSVLLNAADWPPPPPPRVHINDVTVTEGNTGTRSAVFTVNLAYAYIQSVTVAYATADGTAMAGNGYQAGFGTLTFAPGQMTKSITVQVIGDRLPGPNETFFVNLSGPTNATIADGQGVGTIVDDEPRVSISDVTRKEGNGKKTSLLVFTVALSAAYDQPVTMSFRTGNGTATTGDSDYVAKSGTLNFAPGETTKTITIEVMCDNKKEADETFYLDLFGLSSNAQFTKYRGLGTILNDD